MKTLSPHARRCPLCGSPTKKKGRTATGSQRWYCAPCRYSFTQQLTDKARAKEFREFLDYVTDTLPRRVTHIPHTTWDHHHAWCWQTRPIWTITGEVYDQVFLDGTYIGYGWCLLSAQTNGKIIAYQLCDTESKAAYHALLAQIPPPIVVTTDGHAGALAAITDQWPTSHIQRCLVHIQRNIRTVTTTRPTTIQHQALYRL
ncbi:IS1/IS1595 family N-terminal zinc-binding domain-containing protein [Changpingibacter yushuensis]|uniref:IS1/IS1595 family N-terminal zinc-binding domain-containing protein n=1 Tax=Changpingibacter yushuensis TaxID=2758440 RepID=UPI0015F35533|nr:transposase [Changpingibacter yushuensis]